MKNKPENQQPRVVLMIALASAVLVLFLLRLVYLQVIEGNHYLEQADNTTSYRFNITAAPLTPPRLWPIFWRGSPACGYTP